MLRSEDKGEACSVVEKIFPAARGGLRWVFLKELWLVEKPMLEQGWLVGIFFSPKNCRLQGTHAGTEEKLGKEGATERNCYIHLMSLNPTHFFKRSILGGKRNKWYVPFLPLLV